MKSNFEKLSQFLELFYFTSLPSPLSRDFAAHAFHLIVVITVATIWLSYCVSSQEAGIGCSSCLWDWLPSK